MREFHLPGRSEVFAVNGMCATSHPLASQTAIEMLRQGGNAMDAAIAASLVLGLAEPHMAGLGGDCFALVKPSGQDQVVAVNGSGTAPDAASAAVMRDQGHAAVPVGGAQSVTLPGAVHAFCFMSSNWGRKDLRALVSPAIRYADEGIPVAPRVALDWRLYQNRLDAQALKTYAINGVSPNPGQVFRAPGQAEVLRRIAERGAAGFYQGEVAEDMVDALQAAGGCHTLDDFAKVRTLTDTPISGSYRGIELLEHPPNGQGLIAILMANILQEFNMAGYSPNDPYRAHFEIEAAKHAHAARARLLADPEHMGGYDHLLSEATAAELAARIDPLQASAQPAPIREAVHQDTVYVSVVDKDQMAVSLIYSIYHAFGSGLASPRFGILFHNRGAGFSLEQGHPNELAGGKRPMHTIIPAMLREKGRLSTVFGVMGGAYQPTGHVRMLTNWVDYDMGLQQAIDAPRLFADGDTVQIEKGYPGAVAQELALMGHQVQTCELPLGGAQAVRLDHGNGVLIGASDPRKDGCALGY